MRIAARPKRIGNSGPDSGVPVLGNGLIIPGVVGVRGLLRLSRPLVRDPDEGAGVMSEGRRWGVEKDDVERASEEMVRVRGGGWVVTGLAEIGDWTVVDAMTGVGWFSPSCH